MWKNVEAERKSVGVQGNPHGLAIRVTRCPHGAKRSARPPRQGKAYKSVDPVRLLPRHHHRAQR